MGIQVRRGNKANFEPDRLQPGEPVMVSDMSLPGMKMGNGDMAWLISKVKVLSATHTANAIETQTVTLGFRPKYVRIRAEFGISNGVYYDSDGVSDGSTQCSLRKYGAASVPPDVADGAIVAIHSGNGSNHGVIAYTDTGYTLTWGQGSSPLPTGTVLMLVTAIG